MIFSFILILLTTQTALQLSKTMLLEETFMGKIIHKVEVIQIQAIKVYKKYIDMTRKWQWNGKECTITVIIIMDLSEYKHTMSSISMQCI